MFSKNEFESLNPDNLANVVTNLDHLSIRNLSITSKAFFDRFDKDNHVDYWIKKISHDFGIDINYLMQQRKIFLLYSINLKETYLNLCTLNKNQNILPIELGYSYQDKNNTRFILACCTDNVDYFCSVVPLEECELWAFISVFAGCKKLINFSLDLMITLQNDYEETFNFTYLQIIILAGRKDLFINLHANRKMPKIISDYLIHASKSGNIELLEYLLTPENGFNLNLDTYSIIEDMPDKHHITPLNQAAAYGHLELVKFIIDRGVKPSQKTLKNAVKSGNLELVKYLADECQLISQGEQLQPLLPRGLLAGNIALINYLENLMTNKYPDYARGVRIETKHMIGSKNNAIQMSYYEEYVSNPNFGQVINLLLGLSGNTSILKAIKEREKSTGEIIFEISEQSLNLAAKYGHLKMIQCLIEELNIKPTEKTITNAFLSQNLSTIKMLLDINIDFNIEKIDLSSLKIKSTYLYLDSFDRLKDAIQLISEQEGEIVLSHDIYTLLFDSFQAAPQFHLNNIFALLDPESNSLDKKQSEILYTHLTNLKEKSCINSLPIYGKIYSDKIENKIRLLRGDYSELTYESRLKM